MLKKIIFTLFTIIITKSLCFAYDPYIPKGFLIKVYPKTPISTESLEEGSPVSFISPSDVWILEDKAIGKGDIFQGYVSMLKMPVQGINAAMSITITSVINSNGDKKPINGRIIFSNKDVIGGTLTNPASYNKTIHPRKVYGNNWGGTMQYVPSGEYEFGRHIEINMRSSLFVQVDEDYYI